MAKFRLNAGGYFLKRARLLNEVRLGAERSTRREARVLARAMKRVAPYRSGKLYREIRVRKSRAVAGRKRRFFWQVYISRSRFSGFFYPILYLSDMYRKIRGFRVTTRARLFGDMRRIFFRVFRG